MCGILTTKAVEYPLILLLQRGNSTCALQMLTKFPFCSCYFLSCAATGSLCEKPPRQEDVTVSARHGVQMFGINARGRRRRIYPKLLQACSGVFDGEFDPWKVIFENRDFMIVRRGLSTVS